MSEAFKLFGKTIPLPLLFHHGDLTESFSALDSCLEPTGNNVLDDFSDKTSADLLENDSPTEQRGQEMNRESSGRETSDSKQDDCTSNPEVEYSKDPTTTTTSSGDEKPKTSSADRGISACAKQSQNGEQQRETSNSQETELKKPVKILPCPRCNSMDTKFCYYNNYNVNQPRHFCRNCQRYWTAGGTMRNVPVGSGRRKNKSSSASHYRHLIVSERAQIHTVNGVHHNNSSGSSSTVLTFGSDSPLGESVASVLHLSEKTNGSHKPEQKVIMFSGRTTDNGDDRLSGNSATASSPVEKEGNFIFQETVAKHYRQGIPSQLPCFPGPPWPYRWNSTMPGPHAFCPSGYRLSYYPAQPWNCTVPNPWNVPPCLSPQSSSISHCAAASLSPNSPLGKHSREGNMINPANSEDPSRESDYSDRSALVRKTLRIDDHTEAAKSCIRTTSEFKCQQSNPNGGGFFAGFQSKNADRKYIAEKKTCPVLQANPAALLRSLNFHENF